MAKKQNKKHHTFFRIRVRGKRNLEMTKEFSNTRYTEESARFQ